MNSKGTAREVVHVTHASKRRMVYSDNLQENRNYENGIYKNTITRL